MSLPLPIQPPPPPDEPAPRLGVVKGGAHDRFGAIADLAVFQDQAREIALRYAVSIGITPEDFEADPIVTVNCFGMALALQEEMLLQQQKQRDLAERAEQLGGDHGKAMFTAVKNDAYQKIERAINAVHIRAARYRDELESLIRRRRRAALSESGPDPASSCPRPE